MNKFFVTSDWHIGHFNSIKFDNRPYSSLEEMHKNLITRFNSCVPKNGKTFFLGDMGNDLNEVSRILKELNGDKFLILGNHDKGINSMYTVGFDFVAYSAAVSIGGEEVTMSHCPLPGIRREDTTGMKGTSESENWHGEKKNKRFTVENRGQFHLHGHIHSREGNDKSVKILDKQYDVGVPGNNYTPVSFSTIESWITKYKKENYGFS